MKVLNYNEYDVWDLMKRAEELGCSTNENISLRQAFDESIRTLIANGQDIEQFRMVPRNGKLTTQDTKP